MTGTGKKNRTLHIDPVCNVLGEDCAVARQAFMLFHVKIIVIPQK